MNKQDIIKAAAKAAGITQECAAAVINAALDAAADALAHGEPVKIHKYGTFDRRQRSERTVHNFPTDGTKKIPAAMTVHFKPAEDLKRRMNK